MFCAFTRLGHHESVYRTIGPLVYTNVTVMDFSFWRMKVYEVPLTFTEHHLDILAKARPSGERLQDHWTSVFYICSKQRFRYSLEHLDIEAAECGGCIKCEPKIYVFRKLG